MRGIELVLAADWYFDSGLFGMRQNGSSATTRATSKGPCVIMPHLRASMGYKQQVFRCFVIRISIFEFSEDLSKDLSAGIFLVLGIGLPAVEQLGDFA